MRSSRNTVTSVALAASAVLLVPVSVATATTEPPAEPTVASTVPAEPAPETTAAAPETAAAVTTTAAAPETTAAEATAGSNVSAHSQVIAQGVVDFPEGQFTWTPTQEQVDEAGTEVDPQGSQFILGDTGQIVVSNGVGQALIAPGEAIFDPRTLPAALSAVDGAPAGYWAILLASGEFEAGETTIEPGAGARDVNLVRDVLAAGESLSVPSDLPQFVLVTAGAVTTADGLAVDAGASTTVVGGSALTNSGTEPATVVLAVIGDLVGEVPAPTETETTAATETTEPETTEPGTTEPGTTAPASETTAPVDSDGDGLSDEEEAAIGTDPGNTDTDGDGLSDSEEAADQFNSDPTAADTDGDGLDDGEEVDLGTDAGASDTDGDGVDDGTEVDNGTDPLDPASL